MKPVQWKAAVILAAGATQVKAAAECGVQQPVDNVVLPDFPVKRLAVEAFDGAYPSFQRAAAHSRSVAGSSAAIFRTHYKSWLKNFTRHCEARSKCAEVSGGVEVIVSVSRIETLGPIRADQFSSNRCQPAARLTKYELEA